MDSLEISKCCKKSRASGIHSLSFLPLGWFKSSHPPGAPHFLISPGRSKLKPLAFPFILHKISFKHDFDRGGDGCSNVFSYALSSLKMRAASFAVRSAERARRIRTEKAKVLSEGDCTRADGQRASWLGRRYNFRIWELMVSGRYRPQILIGRRSIWVVGLRATASRYSISNSTFMGIYPL